ncbi:hypothetical protein PR048_012991 [Dryococelus australis]|uniref:Uncharacterized protein n=1 Tax=Dryococelus australis TaxID=614101 RepID=A0ABQ9HRQ8_9NEOP|nr:hypothetical protein PR048_012991 [Dryococelus australis]
MWEALKVAYEETGANIVCILLERLFDIKLKCCSTWNKRLRMLGVNWKLLSLLCYCLGVSSSKLITLRDNSYSKNTHPEEEKATPRTGHLSLKTMGLGRAEVYLKDTCGITTIKDVMFVPNMTANVLSKSKLVSCGLSVLFSSAGCMIYKEEEL